MTDPRTPGQKRFAGWLQMVVGGLMAALCGGCTVTYWAGLLSWPERGPLDSAATRIIFALISLAVGVLPTLAGGYLVWSGLRDLGAVRPPSGPTE